MPRRSNLNKEKDLILREHLKLRNKQLDYRLNDNLIQDYITEILQFLRFQKTNKGYTKTMYGGAYLVQLKKTCTKILNVIERYEATKMNKDVPK